MTSVTLAPRLARLVLGGGLLLSFPAFAPQALARPALAVQSAPAGAPEASRPAPSPQDGEAQPPGRTAEEPPTSSPIVTSAQLVGATVRSKDGKELGPVVDLAFDARDGTVLFAAVAGTGTLGAGGRLTAVPVQLLVPSGDGLSLVGATRARFANGVRFSADAWPDASDRIAYALWAGSVWQAFGLEPTWNTGGEPVPAQARDHRLPEGEERGDEAAERARQAAADAAERAQEAAQAEAARQDRPDAVRTSAVVQADVFDAGQQRCGRVRAVCIDLRTGRVACVAAALAAPGAAGAALEEGTLRLLPWRALSCEYGGARLYSDRTAEQLAEAPAVTPGDWPDLATPEWQQRLDAFAPPDAPRDG
jgi:sporulation protein YlmC with PRC-barrel domain